MLGITVLMPLPLPSILVWRTGILYIYISSFILGVQCDKLKLTDTGKTYHRHHDGYSQLQKPYWETDRTDKGIRMEQTFVFWNNDWKSKHESSELTEEDADGDLGGVGARNREK
jgi:hypothetical protein